MFTYHVGPDISERLKNALHQPDVSDGFDAPVSGCHRLLKLPELDALVIIGTERLYLAHEEPPEDFTEASIGFTFLKKHWRAII